MLTDDRAPKVKARATKQVATTIQPLYLALVIEAVLPRPDRAVRRKGEKPALRPPRSGAPAKGNARSGAASKEIAQHGDQRAVGGRHGVGAEARRHRPRDPLSFHRPHAASPLSAHV